MKAERFASFLQTISLLLLTACFLTFADSSFAVLALAQATPAAARSDTQFIDPVAGLTAGDVVRYAIAHNGDLAAARVAIGEVRGRLNQAGLKPNPMLETNVAQAVNGPDNNIMVEVEFPLELKGRRQARQNVAQAELEMRQAEVLDFERRLAAEVRSKYSEVIAAARNLQLTNESFKIGRESHEIVLARVAMGKSAPLEGNEVQVELNLTDSTRIAQLSKAEQALSELKKIIGFPIEDRLVLRGDLENHSTLPSEGEAIAQALATRTDVTVLRKAEDIALAQAEQARREGKIDASIFAGYQRMNLGYDIRGFNDSGALVPVHGVFHMATFGVRFTLPTRNKNQGLVESALSAADAARTRREFLERVIRNEVSTAYSRHARAEAAMTAYRDRVLETADRNLGVVRESYALGYKTALDYLVAQRRFNEIEIGYTEALKEHYDSLTAINSAIGLK